MFYPTNPLSSIRWLPALNVGKQAIPPFGVCQVVAPADSDLTLRIGVPIIQNGYAFFNGPTPIAPGTGGQVMRQFPAYAAIDVGEGPAFLDSPYGVNVGSPYLHRRDPASTGKDYSYLFIGSYKAGVGLFVPSPAFVDSTGVALTGNFTAGAVVATPLVLGSLQIVRPGTYLLMIVLDGIVNGIGKSSVTPLAPPIVGATIQAAIDITGNVDSSSIQAEPLFLVSGYQMNMALSGGDSTGLTGFDFTFLSESDGQSFGSFVAKPDTSPNKPVTISVIGELADVVATVDADRTTIPSIIQASVGGSLAVLGPLEAVPLDQFR